MPPFQTFNIDIKSDDIKLLSAPNYDGLTIDDFLEKIDEYPRMREYMPE